MWAACRGHGLAGKAELARGDENQIAGQRPPRKTPAAVHRGPEAMVGAQRIQRRRGRIQLEDRAGDERLVDVLGEHNGTGRLVGHLVSPQAVDVQRLARHCIEHLLNRGRRRAEDAAAVEPAVVTAMVTTVAATVRTIHLGVGVRRGRPYVRAPAAPMDPAPVATEDLGPLARRSADNTLHLSFVRHASLEGGGWPKRLYPSQVGGDDARS